MLRVGVLPDQDPEVLLRRYSPLLDYLGAEAGLETRLVLPTDYADAVNIFRANEVDLAYFGGLTFVQANAANRAEPLVMRDIDTRFTSWFLVRADRGARKLTEFRDRKFSFGSRLSTSGHLMPRHFLQTRWQIEPEAYFAEVIYSGAHDRTALLVADGTVDLGVANSAVIRQMFDDGRLRPGELEIAWQTPPYPDYVWAVQYDMAPELKIRLRDAFLKLSPARPGHLAVLEPLGSRKYLPAAGGDFADLRLIAANIGLLEEGSRP